MVKTQTCLESQNQDGQSFSVKLFGQSFHDTRMTRREYVWKQPDTPKRVPKKHALISDKAPLFLHLSCVCLITQPMVEPEFHMQPPMPRREKAGKCGWWWGGGGKVWEQMHHLHVTKSQWQSSTLFTSELRTANGGARITHATITPISFMPITCQLRTKRPTLVVGYDRHET